MLVNSQWKCCGISIRHQNWIVFLLLWKESGFLIQILPSNRPTKRFFFFHKKTRRIVSFFPSPIAFPCNSIAIGIGVCLCALCVFTLCNMHTAVELFFFLLHLLCCIAWNACCKYAYARVKKKALDARLYSVFFFCSRTHSIFRLLLSFGSFNRSICLLKIFTISID